LEGTAGNLGEQNGKQGHGEMGTQSKMYDDVQQSESISSKALAHDRQGVVIKKETQESHRIEEEEDQFVLDDSGEEDADEIEWER
jgi:hypothetical protein